MIQKIRSIKNINLQGKKVLLRVDFNVPINENGIVVDDLRIISVLPTIKYLIKQKAKVIIASHFGRPNGRKCQEMSLKPVFNYLKEDCKLQIKFSNNCIGDATNVLAKQLQKSEVLLLENLRFYKEEEQNDIEFARKLADFADIYVNDAFACSHRNHASIDAITKFLPSFGGFALEKELEALSSVFSNSNAPLTIIIGGKKVSTKFDIVSSLIDKCEHLVIAGGMANTFLKAKGIEIGSSFYEEKLLQEVKAFFQLYERKIFLPSDVVCSNTLIKDYCYIDDVTQIKKEHSICDIGTATCIEICKLLDNSKTILWNGPLGLFENSKFSVSSKFIARHIAKITNTGKISIAGGGDVISAIRSSGVEKQFSYISTGGGAFLELLANKTLPGINRLAGN